MLRLILLSYTTLVNLNLSSQIGRNLSNFDRQKFHFGVSIASNIADYRYRFYPGVYNQDSIINIEINKVPGFSFAMISSWDISPLFHLRFIPGFSIQERVFKYGTVADNNIQFEQTRLESFFLDFPLILKLRSKRIHNFAAYAITGLHYGVDLSSQLKVKTFPGDRIMKMKRHDFSTLFGGGFDFFLPYCKFAIEVKINNGLKDLLIQEYTFFTAPLTSLKSKIWTFSITFEG